MGYFDVPTSTYGSVTADATVTDSRYIGATRVGTSIYFAPSVRTPWHPPPRRATRIYQCEHMQVYCHERNCAT